MSHIPITICKLLIRNDDIYYSLLELRNPTKYYQLANVTCISWVLFFLNFFSIFYCFFFQIMEWVFFGSFMFGLLVFVFISCLVGCCVRKRRRGAVFASKISTLLNYNLNI